MPPSLTTEKSIEVMFNAPLPRFENTADAFTPPGDSPVITALKERVLGVTESKGVRDSAIPLSAIGVVGVKPAAVVLTRAELDNGPGWMGVKTA